MANVWVVQYRHDGWDNTSWKFIGVFSSEEKAKAFCEKQSDSHGEWRDALIGEPIGLKMPFVRFESSQTWSVGECEVDKLDR